MKKLFILMLIISSFTFGKIKVGLVFTVSCLEDPVINSTAYKGLLMAKKDFDIDIKYIEPSSISDGESYLRDFAEENYDLVIGIGYLMKDPLEKVANEFPNINFALIEETSQLPNVKSLIFETEEGSFLVGALAAMMSKTGKIGFIGPMETPLTRKFQVGYEKGAKYINPYIKVEVLYTAGNNPFNDPISGTKNTLSLVKKGVDITYHAAWKTGLGVIDGAKENKIYAIGCNYNQDSIAKGIVLTSMVKNIDIAVYNTIKELYEGSFEGGIHTFTLSENGVGTTDFKFTKNSIGEKNIELLEKIKKDIISGKIKIQ